MVMYRSLAGNFKAASFFHIKIFLETWPNWPMDMV